jgi:hypothetical protein
VNGRVGSTALGRQLELTVLAGVDGVQPVLGEGGKLERGLRIYLASAEEYGNVGKILLGFRD